MNLYNICFSPTGGVEKTARLLADALCPSSVTLNVTSAFADRTFGPDDVCLFSAPSFGGRVPAVAMQRFAGMTGQNTRAVLLCVYGNRAYEDTLLEMKNALVQQGFVPVAAVAAIAEHSIMRQYAAGRPDAADAAELKSFAAQIASALENNASHIVAVPGNEPYRPSGRPALKPIASEGCVSCGLCSKNCPVGAIPAGNPRETIADLCITCMRCISLCPNGARALDANGQAALSEKLRPMLEPRKENELFL